MAEQLSAEFLPLFNMTRHRKHSFGVHAAGAKSSGSCFSRVGIPVLVVLVFAGLLTLYIRMGTNMARGKGTIRSAAAVGFDFCFLS